MELPAHSGSQLGTRGQSTGMLQPSALCIPSTMTCTLGDQSRAEMRQPFLHTNEQQNRVLPGGEEGGQMMRSNSSSL